MSRAASSVKCTHGKGFNCPICYPVQKAEAGTAHTATPMSQKRAEVFCVHLDDWLTGGADADEQLTAIAMREQGMSMKVVVAAINEERAKAGAA